MGKSRKHERSSENSFENNVYIERGLAGAAFSLEGFDEAEPGQDRPLAYLEEGLKHNIIGQSEAIESAVTALYRENFRNPNRPIASMLFLGPTGVGKTEFAHVLSKLLHGNEDALLTIDCSTISKDHRVSALLGATPEYVGREQPPMLDRKKIEKPRSIILFDEIEKGAPALRDLLLQILDKGEITLLKDGHKVSFRNSIVIFTSNLGASEMSKLLRPVNLGFGEKQDGVVGSEKLRQSAVRALEASGVFRPELLNRINSKIVFNQLTDEHLEQILERHIRRANEKYAEQGIDMMVSPELLHELVQSCNEGLENRRVYNARPIIDKYEAYIEGATARLISTGGIRRDSHVRATLGDGDVPLAERIKIFHKPVDKSVELVREQTSKKPGKELVKREANLPDVVNNNNNVAVGLAAAAGVAALLVGDYIKSRRRTRRA